MHGVRVSVCIPDDKRHEFFQSVSSLSPSLPVSLFHIFEDTKDRQLFNLTADCIRKEPLKEYLHSDRFKTLLGAINALGSLEDIRMDQSIQTIAENGKIESNDQCKDEGINTT